MGLLQEVAEKNGRATSEKLEMVQIRFWIPKKLKFRK